MKKVQTRFKNINFKIAAVLLLVISTVDLFIFGYNYNLRGQSSSWLKPPQTVSFLKNDHSAFRIDTLGSKEIWNEQFLKKGWRKNPNVYVNFLEALDANLNVVYGINHASLYGIIQTKRNEVMTAIKNQDIKESKANINLGQTARKILDLQNVKYIISPSILRGRDLELVHETQSNPKYFIFENKTVMPRAFVVADWQYGPLPKDQFQIISQENFDPREKVILETKIEKPKTDKINAKVEITKYTNQQVEINAQTDKDAFLVLTDSYYPGWQAFVDGQKAEILAANINQRAIILEKGEHEVKFIYQPESFKKGLIITITSSLLLVIFLVYSITLGKKLLFFGQ